MNFSEVFKQATGHEPFEYQRKLAQSRELPSLLEVPTGMGKTAAAILSWLWRRRYAEDEIRAVTPRRLVYCLPMRVLVEQTRDCAVAWLSNIGKLGGIAKFGEVGSVRKLKTYNPWAGDDDPDKIRVHVIIGGDVDRDWDMFPERDAILIGTQDMLLSRALNRGYALSRFRWPVQFSLLNNDCLWVMDEVQLMGNGLSTTAQLQAFRRIFKNAVPVRSIWMSATINEDWLKTVDFDPVQDAPGKHSILAQDRESDVFRDRFEAKKTLVRTSFAINNDGKNTAQLAKKVHRQGTRTLIVVNTVKRAQAVYQELVKMKNKQKGCFKADLVLLHSRFRQPDRDRHLSRLLAPPGEDGIIAVSTQVIEAGVDVSARTLITELAPWSSLVQRFGRCNRYGEFDEGSIFWIPYADLANGNKLSLSPYIAEDLRRAAERLGVLSDCGPGNLPVVKDSLPFSHVLRLKDLIELFDTTPDLAGADIDVSRFIREADETDVYVFWRDIPESGPSPEEKGPAREELCCVPVNKDLIQKNLWRWNHLEKCWSKPITVYPGLVLMLGTSQGGYNTELGWTGKDQNTDQINHSVALEPESNDDDKSTHARSWQSIAEHTDRVIENLEGLLDNGILEIDEHARTALFDAARWHDAGKAHPQFQQAVPDGAPDAQLWSKSALKMKPYERRGFRHELASALAMLDRGCSDLAAYLAAAHHGKVRLSIRSLPHEERPSKPDQRFARGIWEGDVLPAMRLCKDTLLTETTTLKLNYMELGEDPETGPSWLARMLKLRDTLGPFRLAFLEALLRIADWRASAGMYENGKSEAL